MKKNIMFVGVSICLLILLGIGLSYSMWNMRVSQDTDNVISTTDCFDITLANQSNAIKLDNAYPITDTKGKTLTLLPLVSKMFVIRRLLIQLV